MPLLAMDSCTRSSQMSLLQVALRCIIMGNLVVIIPLMIMACYMKHFRGLSCLFPALTSVCGTQAYKACAVSVLTPKPESSSPAAHVSSQVVSTDACAVRVMSSLASKHIQANVGTASS